MKWPFREVLRRAAERRELARRRRRLLDLPDPPISAAFVSQPWSGLQASGYVFDELPPAPESDRRLMIEIEDRTFGGDSDGDFGGAGAGAFWESNSDSSSSDSGGSSDGGGSND